MLSIGLARADITPRAGIQMWGFGKRVQPALGVSDPLTATALVASDGKTVIAVLDCDLLFVLADFTADLRTRVEGLTGIPGHHMAISCTHTHYGPTIPPRQKAIPSSYEAAYREWLIHQLAGLVCEARNGLQPARVLFGTGTSDIGINRRERTPDGKIILGQNPGGPVDRSVNVLRIETPDGTPLAAVVNFATHPVGQEVNLRMISADYVGDTRRIVQKLTGAPCLFWQGAAGDINIRSAETTPEASTAAGARLGQVAAQAWKNACSIASDPVLAASKVLALPAYRYLSAEHAEQSLRESRRDLEAVRKDPKSSPGLIAWWEAQVQRMEPLCRSWTDSSFLPPPVTADLQVFRIGDLAWACVPGELFNELGQEIKRRSPFAYTLIAAYSNDWIGYMPTTKAFQEGGYEVSQSCRLAPEAMPMMIEEFERMFREMAASPKKRHRSATPHGGEMLQ